MPLPVSLRRCVWALLVAGLPGAVEEPALAVDVAVQNLSDQPLANVPVTFGQVFKKGEITDGIAAQLDGKPFSVQADVKRFHDDRSIRFAVISARLSNLPPAGKTVIRLANGKLPPASLAAVSREDLLKTDFDAIVTLTFPDGAIRRASARRMLEKAGENAETWLHGPVATEWLLSGPPTDAQGKPDEDLAVQFQVRAYAGCRRVRASVVVENCWDTWAGNVRYDAAVTVGGKEAFTAKAVDHRRLSRWRKVFWWGEGEPPVHVAHDLPYLSSTGALHPDGRAGVRDHGPRRPDGLYAFDRRPAGDRPLPQVDGAVPCLDAAAREGSGAGRRRPGRFVAHPRAGT